MSEWIYWIYAAVAFIAAASWVRWFWQGYAYRGGFKSPTNPLLWTIVALLLLIVFTVIDTASSADFSPDCTYRDAESLKMRDDCNPQIIEGTER